MKCIRYIVLICFTLVLFSCKNASLDERQSYEKAVGDVLTLNESDIRDLVTLRRDDLNSIYYGDKVAVATLHSDERYYHENEEITLQISALWLFSPSEMNSRMKKNSKDCSLLRLKQIIGVAPDYSLTHVSVVLVDPKKLYRPAYESDPFVNHMSFTLSSDSKEFTAWFKENKKVTVYPWTALGYTYDYGADDHYGVSEFVLLKGGKYKTIKTIDIESYIKKGCML